MASISSFTVDRLQKALKCTWTTNVVIENVQSIKLYYTDSGANDWYTHNVQITSATLPTIAIINDLDSDKEYKVYLVIYTQGQIYTSETKYATPAGFIKKPTFTTRRGDGHIQLVFHNDSSSNLITSDLSNNSYFDGGSAITNILVSINKIDEIGVGLKVLNCPVFGSVSSDGVFLFNNVHFYDEGILIIPELDNGFDYEVAVTYVNEFGPSELSTTHRVKPDKLPETIDVFALNARYLVPDAEPPRLEIGVEPAVVVYWETPTEAVNDGYENIIDITKYQVYKKIAADVSFNKLCDVNFVNGAFTTINNIASGADLSFNIINLNLNVDGDKHISIDNCNRLVDYDVSAGTQYTYRVVPENEFGSSAVDNDSNHIIALKKPTDLSLSKSDLSFNNFNLESTGPSALLYTNFNNDSNFNYSFMLSTPNMSTEGSGFSEPDTISVEVKKRATPTDPSFNTSTKPIDISSSNLTTTIDGFAPKNTVEIKLTAQVTKQTTVVINNKSNVKNNSSTSPRILFSNPEPQSVQVFESSTVESDTITYTFYGPLSAPATLVSTNVDVNEIPTPGQMRLTWPLITDTNGPDLSANLIYYELTITDLSAVTTKVKYLLNNSFNLDSSANNLKLFRPDLALPTDLSYNTILDNLPYYASDSSSAYTKFHYDASNGYVDISCNLGHKYSYSIKTQYYNTDDNIYVLSSATSTLDELVSFDRPSAPTISTALVKEIAILDTDKTIYADGAKGTVVSGTTYGWGFSNPNSNGSKINWYYFNKQTSGKSIQVKELTNMYCVIKQLSDISDPFNPFFILYTTPKGSGDAASWYHSKLFYGSNDIPANVDKSQQILLYTGTDDKSVHPEIPTSNRQQLQLNSSLCNPTTITDAVVSNSTDEINLISLQTSSNVVAYNKYNFSCTEMGLKSLKYDQKSICVTSGAITTNYGINVTFQLDDNDNTTGFLNSDIKFRGEILKNGGQIYTKDLSANTSNTILFSDLSGVSVGDLLNLQVVAYLDDIKYISNGSDRDFDSGASNQINYNFFGPLSNPSNFISKNVDTSNVPTPNSMKLNWNQVNSNGGAYDNSMNYILTVTKADNVSGLNASPITNTNFKFINSDSYEFTQCTLGKWYSYQIYAQYYNTDFDINITSDVVITGRYLVSFSLPLAPNITNRNILEDGSIFTFDLSANTNNSGSESTYKGTLHKGPSSLLVSNNDLQISGNSLALNDYSLNTGDLLTLTVDVEVEVVTISDSISLVTFSSSSSDTFSFKFFKELPMPTNLSVTNVDGTNPLVGIMKLTWTDTPASNAPNNELISYNLIATDNNVTQIPIVASTEQSVVLGHSYTYKLQATYLNTDFDNKVITSDYTTPTSALVSFAKPPQPSIQEFELELDGTQFSFIVTPGTNSTGLGDESIHYRATITDMSNTSIYRNNEIVQINRQTILLSELSNNTSIIAGHNLRLTIIAYLNIKTVSTSSDTPEFTSSDAVVNTRYTKRPQIKDIDISNSVITILVEPNGNAITQLAYLAITSTNSILHGFIQDIDVPNPLSSLITTNSDTKDVTITLNLGTDISDIKVAVGNNNGFDFNGVSDF